MALRGAGVQTLPMSTRSLSEPQKDALLLITTWGKMTSSRAKMESVRESTLDSLVRHGLLVVTTHVSPNAADTFKVWRLP